jgi:hypothetical protein
MYQFAETQDSRIAHYSFGSAITSHGLTVFSCTDAREGKKIFGNDPDPEKEIPLNHSSDPVTEHIKKYPDGIVAQNEDEIREYGKMLQVHHRTVMFGSDWKSDSLRPAHRSFVYHKGAYTHFRMPGLARLISLEDHGIAACSGFENLTATNRRVHLLDASDEFTPMKVGSIIVPMHDVWYHKTKLKQHYPFLISEADTVQITIDEPTVIIEFTDEEPDVAEFSRTWLQQIEDGIIEIVDR